MAEALDPSAWGAVPVDDGPAAWGAVPHSGQPAGFAESVKDVARTIPGHLAKGALGVAGIPGDVMSAADAAADWVNRKYKAMGFDVKPSRIERVAPTSGELTGKVEEKTGKFYEPHTMAGKVAGTAAEFVPGAILPGFGGGIIRNALRYGVVPGAASELAGQAAEGTATEPWARLAAAVTAGGIGAIATQPRTAERFIRAQMPDYVTDAAVTKADSLIRDAAASGVRLTWPEALSQVTGKPVLNDMQRIMEGAKQTRSVMQEALGGRPGEIHAAAEDVAAGIAPQTAQPSTIGPAAGTTAEGRIGEVRQTINQVSEPFYDAAKTHTLTPAEMAQVRAIPGYADAARAVRNDAQLNRHVEHLPENSIGFLNEVKKQLDQAAQNAASPVQQGRSVQRAAGLGSDAQAVRDAAINSEAAAGGGNYAQALHIQEQGRQRFLEPLLHGPLGKLADKDITTQKAIGALFPSEPLAGSAQEVAQAVHAISQKSPTVARQLVRAHVEAKLNEAFDAAGRTQEAAGFAGAGLAQRLSGSPVVPTQRGQNFKAAVKALPNGRQIWPGVERFLETMQATGWRQPIGSKTAFNEADLHAMATGKSIANLAKTAASPGEWWHAAHEMWGKWQTGNNLAALARIITDPRSEGVFRRIVKMRRGNAEAVNMAARLTAGVGMQFVTQAQDKKP